MALALTVMIPGILALLVFITLILSLLGPLHRDGGMR